MAVDARVQFVIDQIEQHLGRRLSIRELARSVNLTPAHLTRLFRRDTGQSARTYTRALRLRRAYDLLEHSALSVKEVMAHVGWSDASHFSRDFKRAFGVSPMQLRRGVRDQSQFRAPPAYRSACRRRSVRRTSRAPRERASHRPPGSPGMSAAR